MTPARLTRILATFDAACANGDHEQKALASALHEFGASCADAVVLETGELFKVATAADLPALKRVPAVAADNLAALVHVHLIDNTVLSLAAVADLEREAQEGFWARLGVVLRGLVPEARA